jgi:undecaprenyl-diphosphatase
VSQEVEAEELATGEGVLLAAALLGIVEGLTEFIPVSSTGHLILLVDFFGVKTPPGRIFEVVIQFGAIAAVIVLYWKKLFGKAVGFFTKPADRRFVFGILLAFLPAAVVGVFARDFVKSVLYQPIVIASALILGGIVILVVERLVLKEKVEDVDDIDLLSALKIGAVQCLAFVPGVSRSGATIIGARLMGVGRKAAAEFSFFVAIPTMLGAASYDLWSARDALSTDAITMIAVGFTAAFVAALIVVRAVVGFISKHGFAPFAYYRFALGALIFALLAFGVGAA